MHWPALRQWRVRSFRVCPVTALALPTHPSIHPEASQQQQQAAARLPDGRRVDRRRASRDDGHDPDVNTRITQTHTHSPGARSDRSAQLWPGADLTCCLAGSRLAAANARQHAEWDDAEDGTEAGTERGGKTESNATLLNLIRCCRLFHLLLFLRWSLSVLLLRRELLRLQSFFELPSSSQSSDRSAGAARMVVCLCACCRIRRALGPCLVAARAEVARCLLLPSGVRIEAPAEAAPGEETQQRTARGKEHALRWQPGCVDSGLRHALTTVGLSSFFSASPFSSSAHLRCSTHPLLHREPSSATLVTRLSFIGSHPLPPVVLPSIRTSP